MKGSKREGSTKLLKGEDFLESFKRVRGKTLFGDLFLVGSVEQGSACDPLCAKVNRRKGNLEAKKISSLGENNLVSIDSGISFLSS